jgi:hypothetical protein
MFTDVSELEAEGMEMLEVEVALSFDGLWDFTPRKVGFVVSSGMNGVRFHFVYVCCVLGGRGGICLVAKQFSLAGGSLRVEINGQCWISRSSTLLTMSATQVVNFAWNHLVWPASPPSRQILHTYSYCTVTIDQGVSSLGRLSPYFHL